MRRRALLASTTTTLAALGTAGCLSDGGGTAPGTDSNASSTTETSDSGTATTTSSTTRASNGTLSLDGVTFEVGGLRLQSTFVEQGDPFWNWDAKSTSEGLYAVLPLAPTATDEGEAVEAVRNARVATAVDGASTTATHLVNEYDQDPLRLAAPISVADDPESAAVVLGDDRGRYPLADDQLAALADPPDLAVDVRIPDETDGQRVPVELEIANDGASAGTLAWTTTHSVIADAWWTHRTTVPAGETRTVEHVHDRLGGDPDESIRVTVDDGYTETSKPVAVTED